MTIIVEAPEKSEILAKQEKQARERSKSEFSRMASLLRSREDYSPAYDYFLELSMDCRSPAAAARRSGRTVANLLCIQAPVELIHAAGFHPFKVSSGAQSAWNFASHSLPTLMCPLLRAIVGSVKMGGDVEYPPFVWIIPTTCDWVVKLPELMSGAESKRVHWLELPHLKDGERGQKRWLEEVYGLKKFLESEGGKIDRRELARSIELYQAAWRALARLDSLRMSGVLPNIWFMLIAGSFFHDSIERWTEEANLVEPVKAAEEKRNTNSSRRVFLAGSPIFFPNYKLPLLIEEAGMEIVCDDLCSSGRVIPGAVTYDDASEFGLMSALAQRYHCGCLCPTFIDNDRRINNIIGQSGLVRGEGARFRGVIFHVLKGCHPYDIESVGLESSLKERGMKFIRLETDYSAGDERNLLARLEAFCGTLDAL